ncbi:hypothetical protein FACS1894186_7970 [Alphaproteobacteria bacterium]|nr:hypothetical protein FACS1894186_7970 [Alphaproteobacteria bacterium]
MAGFLAFAGLTPHAGAQTFKELQAKVDALKAKPPMSPDAESEYLKSIEAQPRHMWQYMIPALYASGVPFSFLNRPEFLKYKGAKPTRIAREVKDFADQYLDDLSPDYYYLLSPEAWSTPSHETGLARGKTGGDKTYVIVNDSIIPFSKGVAAPDILDDAIDRPTSDPDGLTKEQVAAFLASVPDFLAAEAKLERLMLLHAMEGPGGLFRYMREPCRVAAEAYVAEGLGADLKAMAEKQKMTLSEWLRVCDRTFKGYRANRLTLMKARGIFTIAAARKMLERKAVLNEMERTTRDMWDAYIDYYAGSEEDRQAVADRMDEIRPLFTSHKFIYQPDP